MSKFRNRFIFAALAFFGALGLVAYIWVGSVLMAPAFRPAPEAPSHLGAQSVEIGSTSGSTLSAWLASPPKPRGAVVLLHCVRCARSDMLGRAELLWNAGYAVLLPDLQAHGESTGDAITFGHLESRDALASVEFVRSRFPNLPVVGIGTSLGGAAFLLASDSIGLDALVLESVYPTIEEAVDNRIDIRLGWLSKVMAPLLMLQLEPRLGVSTADLRPIDHIGSVGCPVLVAAGTEDRHTRLAETQRFFAAAREPKELWLVEGAAHVDLLRFDPEGYATTVLGFLERHERSQQ